MKSVFSKLFDSLFTKKNDRMLMICLDAASKTTILKKLKICEVVSSVPTVCFNVVNLEYKNVKFTIFNVGG